MQTLKQCYLIKINKIINKSKARLSLRIERAIELRFLIEKNFLLSDSEKKQLTDILNTFIVFNESALKC